MNTELTQYIVRGLIVLVTIGLSVASLYLLNHFRGSRFEKPVRYFGYGFIFIAVAKFVAIGTKFLIENGLIPKTLKWIMSAYEVIGMFGLLVLVVGIYKLVFGEDTKIS